MTTKLNHGTLVRLATWKNSYARVGTIEGYANEDTRYGTPEATIQRAVAMKQPMAWTSYAGSTICADPGFYERHAAQVASATVIAHGETVEIEGRYYAVRVVRGNDGAFPRNSDPIAFTPI
jgi:hypothetical protein